MTLVVHPHFHFRRTGTTSHVEAIVGALQGKVEARALGVHLAEGTPRLGWGQLWRRAMHEPLVWHAHRNNELIAGLMLRALGRRVRVVFTRHSATPPSAFTRFLYRRADALVALTPEVAGLVRHPSTVVGHGVDVERFCPPEDRARVWADLGQGGTYGLGVVGRVRPEKGQGDFVEALRPLLAEFPAWRGVLVGRVKPPERAWAEGLLASVPEGLRLVPEQADVVPWYQGLQVVVQPSHSEGFSLVLLEALASGCCVVAARLPHFPGLMDHGRTGFFYSPGDVVGLRAVLRRLMENPQLAKDVGARAAVDARERLGLEHEAAALTRVYARSLPSGVEAQ